jgi:RNA polymerase sigma-70 factor (ECF subfamily)
VRNDADAWDLAQDVFVKAWKALPRFQGQAAFFSWLYRIAHNVALDWMRARKVEGGVEFDDSVAPQIEAGAATAPREAGQPDERLSRAELIERINAALAELSPDHRAVILLREVDGRSYEEIAEVIGCSTGTVMSRLFYARKRLQTLLEDVYHSNDRT